MFHQISGKNAGVKRRMPLKIRFEANFEFFNSLNLFYLLPCFLKIVWREEFELDNVWLHATFNFYVPFLFRF